MSKEKIEAQIKFPEIDKEQLKHLSDAKKALGKAGVTFDTGYDLGTHTRDWEFDWSLKGAEVILKKFKKEKK